MAEGGDAPQHIQLKAFLKLSVAEKSSYWVLLMEEILHQLRCSLSVSPIIYKVYTSPIDM